MMKARGNSNKIKQKQLETKYLEQQTKKMQDKLAELKKQVDQKKKLKSQLGMDKTVTRWQNNTKGQAPLKSYAKQILEEQKLAYNKFGISQKAITGTKTFQGVLKQLKEEKSEIQEKMPTKITTIYNPNQPIQPQLKLKQQTFFKAKMDTKNLIKQKTLEQFLEENFIQEYLRRFEEAEINDLESLRYVSREQLSDLGVKAGHQVKIIKKIKQQFDKMLQGKYQNTKRQQNTQEISQKVEFGYGDTDINEYQHQQKQEQVDELEKADSEHSDYFQQQQDVVLITIPFQQIALQSQQVHYENCFQCYKRISINLDTIERDSKFFCGETCLSKYLAQYQKNCPQCGKKFLKTEGFRQMGEWFCSLGCCPNHQYIEDIFFNWKTGEQ